MAPFFNTTPLPRKWVVRKAYNLFYRPTSETTTAHHRCQESEKTVVTLAPPLIRLTACCEGDINTSLAMIWKGEGLTRRLPVVAGAHNHPVVAEAHNHSVVGTPLEVAGDSTYSAQVEGTQEGGDLFRAKCCSAR